MEPGTSGDKNNIPERVRPKMLLTPSSHCHNFEGKSVRYSAEWKDKGEGRGEDLIWAQICNDAVAASDDDFSNFLFRRGFLKKASWQLGTY